MFFLSFVGMDFNNQLELLIKNALAEDIGDGDHSTLSCINASAEGKAILKIKEAGILAGVDVAEKIFKYMQGNIVFTAFKNIACGAIVQWHIDAMATDSVLTLNDSTFKIWFKNSNWQGKLYASITAGACYAQVTDSLFITVAGQPVLNLGPDTILCAGNSIILLAGNTFSGYVWQDGSTGTTYTVVAPGMYYVTVSDGCGNNLSDTVNVTAAFFPFTIGT